MLVWFVIDKPKTEVFRDEVNQLYDLVRYSDYDDKVTGRLDKMRDRLVEISVTPYETVGMKKLKDLHHTQKSAAYTKYKLPIIKNTLLGIRPSWEDQDEYIGMTLEKYLDEYGDRYIYDSAPTEIRRAACIEGRFCCMYNPMDFYAGLLEEKDNLIVRDKSYMDPGTRKSPEDMINFAEELDKSIQRWEQDNTKLMKIIAPNKKQLLEFERDTHWSWSHYFVPSEYAHHERLVQQKHGQKFIQLFEHLEETAYPYYRSVEDAIKWLRFWGNRGHGHKMFYYSTDDFLLLNSYILG
jgi:hypothetical protein